MEYQEFIRRYSQKDGRLLPTDFQDRVRASLAVQVHTTGARPAYTINGRYFKPENYDERFDELFRYRILNRHPNESEDSYNWRLSVFSPVAKEIYDRYYNFAIGCILQPNNFVISADDKTNEYLTKYNIQEVLKSGLDFILNNPKGFYAVVVRDYDGQQTSQAQAQIKWITPQMVLMRDTDSVAFQCDSDIIYLNREVQITKFEKGQIQAISHRFGLIPFFECENSFAQPFISWADQLARNFSDDEMMTKQYSYPVKQLVVPQCGTCRGSGKVDEKAEGTNVFTKKNCPECDGKGTISVNPGEHVTLTEEKLHKLGLAGMPDYVKFATPDVSIPKYHFDRCMSFYEKAERALYLNKRISSAESGEAKREDRRDQYVQLATVSNFLFDIIRKGITLISAYLNYNASSGRYVPGEVVVIAPKQMDMMTDADMVEELVGAQSKTDDAMILGEIQFAVTNRLYRDDKVQSRINDLLYELDPLYGVSKDSLQRKYLSGVYDNRDKVIHEKGYFVLRGIAREMMPERFLEAQTAEIVSIFNERIEQFIPQGIYSE